MIPIKFPKQPNTLFRSGTIIFHVINYFNMDVRMNRLPYLAIIIGLSFLFTPVLAYIFPENAIENPNTIFDNLSLGQTIIIEAYGLLILPAYLKRMKDVDFSPIRIEIVLSMIYGTAVLHTFLSEEMIQILAPVLGLANIIITILMVMLIIIPGTSSENKYGNEPTKNRERE